MLHGTVFVHVGVIVENNKVGIGILLGDRLAAADAVDEGFKVILKAEDEIVAITCEGFQRHGNAVGRLNDLVLYAKLARNFLDGVASRLVIAGVVLTCRAANKRDLEVCLASCVLLAAAGKDRDEHEQCEAQTQDFEVLFHDFPLLTKMFFVLSLMTDAIKERS